jgi:hypothetical protein
MEPSTRDQTRIVVNDKRFVGFQNVVGTQETYESILAQKNLIAPKKLGGISRGLKPQRYFDVKERLQAKLKSRDNSK